ncbi:hypothetical protein ACS0TY_032040 [Phlomoides rotata]
MTSTAAPNCISDLVSSLSLLSLYLFLALKIFLSSFIFYSYPSDPISINTATIKPCYTAAACPSLRRSCARACCPVAAARPVLPPRPPNAFAAARPQLLRPSQPPNRPSTGGNHTKQVVQHLYCSLHIKQLNVACVFTINSQLEDEASTSLSKRRLHLKKSWGMPVLFLSSVVFALGHIVVAYRTIIRRFFDHPPQQLVSLSEIMVKQGEKQQGWCFDDMDLPVSLLTDADNLFISCQGLTVHYKLCMPGLPSRSLSSTTFFVQPSLSRPLKNHHNIHRSNSNTFHSSLSPLYTPLLASSPTSSVSEDVPIFCLNENCEDDELGKLGSPLMVAGVEANEQFGIVLVHGFGGGVFSWRKVMGTLARQTGCAVSAFDRPGWGLTSRPR